MGNGAVRQSAAPNVGIVASQVIVNANANRRYLRVVNTGANAALLAWNTEANAAIGYPLAAGAAQEWVDGRFVPTGQLSALALVGATSFIIVEG